MVRYMQEDFEGTEVLFEELTLLFQSAPELRKRLAEFWLESNEPPQLANIKGGRNGRWSWYCHECGNGPYRLPKTLKCIFACRHLKCRLRRVDDFEIDE